MIFCAKNEDGVPTWKLVLQGKKTVTRRLKPVEVGKILAVQPNRGKKQVARIRVKSCISHEDWFDNVLNSIQIDYDDYWYILFDEEGLEDALDAEARLEGFGEWFDLVHWFNMKRININDTYRIEFEVVDICLGCKHYECQRQGVVCSTLDSKHLYASLKPTIDQSNDGVWSCSEFKLRGVER